MLGDCRTADRQLPGQLSHRLRPVCQAADDADRVTARQSQGGAHISRRGPFSGHRIGVSCCSSPSTHAQPTPTGCSIQRWASPSRHTFAQLTARSWPLSWRTAPTSLPRSPTAATSSSTSSPTRSPTRAAPCWPSRRPGTCAFYVLVAEDGSVLGRFNLYDFEDGRPAPARTPPPRRYCPGPGSSRPARR